MPRSCFSPLAHSAIHTTCNGCELFPATDAKQVCGTKPPSRIYRERAQIAAEIQCGLDLSRADRKAILETILRTAVCPSPRKTPSVANRFEYLVWEVEKAVRWPALAPYEIAAKPWLPQRTRVVLLPEHGEVWGPDVTVEAVADRLMPLLCSEAGRRLMAYRGEDLSNVLTRVWRFAKQKPAGFTARELQRARHVPDAETARHVLDRLVEAQILERISGASTSKVQFRLKAE